MGLLFLLLLSLPHCGFLESDGGGGGDSSERTYDTTQQAEITFSQSTVECAEQNCPAATAGLYLRISDREVGTCSGTLITENRVLTNAHCIPKDIHFVGASCDQRIKVNFPKLPGFPARRVNCRSIQLLSKKAPFKKKDDIDVPDYAVIELSQSLKRPPAVLSKEGLPDFSQVSLYKVDFDLSIGSPVVGKMKATLCQANTNHQDTPFGIGAVSALFGMSDCDQKLIRGNSGTGLFNQKGQLVGLHSFGVRVMDSNKSWAVKLRRKYPHIKQNYGGGTNLACVSFHGEEVSDRCVFEVESYRRLARHYAKLRQAEASGVYLTNESPEVLNFMRSREKAGMTFYEKASDLMDQMSFALDGASYWVFKKQVDFAFPVLPRCFPGSVDESSIEWPINQVSVLIQEDFETRYHFRSVENPIGSMDFFWNPSQGLYEVPLSGRIQDPLFSKQGLRALGLESENLTLKVPACDH